MPTNAEIEITSNATRLAQYPELLFVRNTPKGRGIFAARDIPSNTLIEVSPVLVFNKEEYEEHLRRTTLFYYTYNWPVRYDTANHPGTENVENALNTNRAPLSHQARRRYKTVQHQALPLGLGAVFNHARIGRPQHNVGWMRDIEAQVIRYTTLRTVRAGEELCICYGEKITFVDADVETDDAANLYDESNILELAMRMEVNVDASYAGHEA